MLSAFGRASRGRVVPRVAVRARSLARASSTHANALRRSSNNCHHPSRMVPQIAATALPRFGLLRATASLCRGARFCRASAAAAAVTGSGRVAFRNSLPLARAFSSKRLGSSSGNGGPSVLGRLVRLAAALGLSVLVVSALAGVAVAWTVHSNAKILDVVVPLSDLDNRRISATLMHFHYTWNATRHHTKRVWAATKAGQLSWALLMLMTSEEEGSTDAARSFDLSELDDDVVPMSVSRSYILRRLLPQKGCASGGGSDDRSTDAELLSSMEHVDQWRGTDAGAESEDINLTTELDFHEDHDDDAGASDGSTSVSGSHAHSLARKTRGHASKQPRRNGCGGSQERKNSAEEAVALEMLSDVLAPFLSICQRASSHLMPAAFKDEAWTATQAADKVRAVDWIIGAIHAVAAFRLLTPARDFISPSTKPCFKGKDQTALGVHMLWGDRAEEFFCALDVDGSKQLGRPELLQWLHLLHAARKVVAVADAAMEAGEGSDEDFMSIYTRAVVPLASVDLEEKVDELLARTASGTTLTRRDLDEAFMLEFQKILMGSTNEETPLQAQALESEFLINN